VTLAADTGGAHRANRASFGWLGLLLVAVLLFPWYRGGSLGASALGAGLGGQPWLLPIAATALVLGGLAAAMHDWRRHGATLTLAVAGLVFLLSQAFGIGLNGPALPALAAIWPGAAQGQTGMGPGGFIAGLALLGLISDALAARGFCRGERFAAACVVIIATLLSLFVFFPILKLGAAAFTDSDGAVAITPFLTRVTAPDLWGLACLTSRYSCGVVINTVVLGVLSAALATALGLALALLVARTDFRFKRMLRAISILPIITPPFVVGVAIIVLFGRSGGHARIWLPRILLDRSIDARRFTVCPAF